MSLDRIQREALGRIFKNKLREEPFFRHFGPTTKSLLIESIVLVTSHLDPKSETVVKEVDGKKVNYVKFEIKLTVPVIGMPIVISHEMPEAEVGILV